MYSRVVSLTHNYLDTQQCTQPINQHVAQYERLWLQQNDNIGLENLLHKIEVQTKSFDLNLVRLVSKPHASLN